MKSSKEQEEAIERLKYLTIDLKSSKKVNEIVTKEGKFNLVKDLETVLNMLKEKDEKIESLEKTLDKRFIYVTEARTVYARLMSLDKEDIVKNDLALRNEIYQHIEDNDKKDKIIDLMAEYIFQNVDVEEDICNSAYVECTQETAQDITCINCIKQYFERKNEEWKKI